jgi:hypothetical protein
VEAPLAVSEVLLPAQIVALDVVALTAGNAFTVTANVAVPEHPGPLEPVTV